jgi:hypothetical protein
VRGGVLKLVASLSVLVLVSARPAAPTIAIDAASPAGKVSPLLYGLMTEEINHAYDGGLYAELVRNRAFLDDKTPAATAVTIAADAQATNSIDAPDRVVPVTSKISGVKSGFSYTVPAHGIVVLELSTR